MKKTVDLSFLFGLGASFYYLLEVLWRGFSHWTMAVLGGVCAISLYVLNSRLRGRRLLLRAALGCLIITSLEFVVGCIVNLILGWKVWDYSGLSFNIAGQVCPAFSLLWFVLCFPAMGLCTFMRGKMEADGR